MASTMYQAFYLLRSRETRLWIVFGLISAHLTKRNAAEAATFGRDSSTYRFHKESTSCKYSLAWMVECTVMSRVRTATVSSKRMSDIRLVRLESTKLFLFPGSPVLGEGALGPIVLLRLLDMPELLPMAWVLLAVMCREY